MTETRSSSKGKIAWDLEERAIQLWRNPRKHPARAEGPPPQSPTILETSPRLIRKELECVDLTLYRRKTNTEPLLQTEDLSQLQATQKAEEIHQFRQNRTRPLSIRDTDREKRFKLKDKDLEMYGGMRLGIGNVSTKQEEWERRRKYLRSWRIAG